MNSTTYAMVAPKATYGEPIFSVIPQMQFGSLLLGKTEGNKVSYNDVYFNSPSKLVENLP